MKYKILKFSCLKSSILSLILIFIFLLFGYVWIKSKGKENLTESYKYKIETQWDENKGRFKQSLVKISNDLSKEVIVNDLLEKLSSPNLQEVNSKFLKLEVFAQPSITDQIFLGLFVEGTDDPFYSLYAFNPENKSFKKMKINDLSKDEWKAGGVFLSTDETKFIWIPNEFGTNGKDQKMYLVNLIHDNYKLLLELSQNETFNGCGDFFHAYYDVKWINDQKIKFGVYDQSKKKLNDYYKGIKNCDDIAKESLIEYREIKLVSP